MSHTKTPWKILRKYSVETDGRLVIGFFPMGQIVYPYDSDDEALRTMCFKEADANEKLILDAVNLHDELIGLAKYLGEERNPNIYEAMSMAMDILKKAKEQS